MRGSGASSTSLGNTGERSTQVAINTENRELLKMKAKLVALRATYGDCPGEDSCGSLGGHGDWYIKQSETLFANNGQCQSFSADGRMDAESIQGCFDKEAYRKLFDAER